MAILFTADFPVHNIQENEQAETHAGAVFDMTILLGGAAPSESSKLLVLELH